MRDLESKTVQEYIEKLDPDRKKEILDIQNMIKRTGKVTTENIEYGMPCYFSASGRYVAVASQKHYISIYVNKHILGEYTGELKIPGVSCGKSCIRFKSLEKLPVAIIEEIINRTLS